GIRIDGVVLSERSGEAEIRHEEYRDDRYVAAISLRGGGRARLYYLVRAVTPGTYTVPPPQVEDMYQPTLRGTGAARPSQVTLVHPWPARRAKNTPASRRRFPYRRDNPRRGPVQRSDIRCLSALRALGDLVAHAMAFPQRAEAL